MHKKASSLTALIAATTLSAPVLAQETGNDGWMDDARCIVHTTLMTNEGFETEENSFYTLARVDSTEYRVPIDSLALDVDEFTVGFPDEIQGYRTAPLASARMSFTPDSLASVRFDGPHNPFPEYIFVHMEKIGRFARLGGGIVGEGGRIEEHKEFWNSLTSHAPESQYAIPCKKTHDLHMDPNKYIRVEYFTQETLQNGTPR